MQETKELTGQFSREQSDYGYTLYYENSYRLKLDQIEKAKEYKKLKQESISAEKELLKSINDSIVDMLPKGFVISTISLENCTNGYLSFKSRCEGMSIARDDTTKKEDAVKKVEELDAYQKLARHHELKQILNCGVLTTAEKRKVLGLPELKGEEK